MNIPSSKDYIQIIKKRAQALSLKLSINGTTVTVQASESLQIYNLLNYISHFPALSIESFTLETKKGKMVGTIRIAPPTLSGVGRSQPVDSHLRENDGDFYPPWFFYVNASNEVDGRKQIWVNGKKFGESCPWPLYHTFDKKTGCIKKGDLRPQLALTSKT